MAFSKTARAAVVHANWGTQNWSNFVAQNRSLLANGPYRTASASPNLVAQASELLGETFDPKNYLLTHATIVASVEVEDVPNVKLGRQQELGRNVNRRWADYRIQPDCDMYINNNHDAWSRDVLLKSYRTFVGAHNFVEHVQVEEQSKGRIIDAVARDIGNSVYVDILVATNLKHASLINDIKSGRMSTMSMGCSVTETICTKCGHVAADETEMCEHVKYQKGNYEYDSQGRRYRIAELCGHRDLNPTGGVHFIEASWVAIPAFQGAVMRNIVQPDAINIDTQNQMRSILASPGTLPQEWLSEMIGKAASQQAVAAMPPPPPPPGGGMDMGMGMPGDPGGGEQEKDPLEEISNDLEQFVLNKIKKNLREKMKDKAQEKAMSNGELGTSTGDDLVKQGSDKTAYQQTIDTIVKLSSSDVEMVDWIARYHDEMGIKVSRDLYRTALRVGSTARHDTLDSYLAVCGKVLGRQPTMGEAKTLIRLGQILSIRK
jgi:hypothetical protein